jgi:hypothetical protein
LSIGLGAFLAINVSYATIPHRNVTKTDGCAIDYFSSNDNSSTKSINLLPIPIDSLSAGIHHDRYQSVIARADTTT